MTPKGTVSALAGRTHNPSFVGTVDRVLVVELQLAAAVMPLVASVLPAIRGSETGEAEAIGGGSGVIEHPDSGRA